MKLLRISIIVLLLVTFLVSPQARVFAQGPSDPCPGLSDQMLKNLAAIDSPAHRGEYALMDRTARCMVVGGVTRVIPLTGVRTGYNDPLFKAYKERQADEMSKGRW